ncbi:MAG: hypothetical protein ACK4YO_02205, partial [Candidatus Altarchaeaceae archaeon]
YIMNKNLTIDKIFNDRIYGSVIRISIERIKRNCDEKFKYYEEISKFPEGYELWLMSYGVSKMFINLNELKFYKNKYAEEESKLFEKFINEEDKEKKEKIIKEILNYEKIDDKIFVDFVDYLRYLRYLKNLKDKDDDERERLKLVNRILDKGKVIIKENDLLDIAVEFVKEKFNENIDVNEKELSEEILDEIKKLSLELKNKISENIRKIVKIQGNIDISDIPPSIARIIEKIKENTETHNERFVLATYL